MIDPKVGDEVYVVSTAMKDGKPRTAEYRKVIKRGTKYFDVEHTSWSNLRFSRKCDNGKLSAHPHCMYAVHSSKEAYESVLSRDAAIDDFRRRVVSNEYRLRISASSTEADIREATRLLTGGK